MPIRLHILIGALPVLLLCAFAFSQQQTQPQPVADTGFEQIFDGKTLTGWEGDPKYWRVENECLVGEITPGNQIQQNTFIIWKAGTTKDFELKLDYRISSGGNSGINYRSSELPDIKLAMKGYQFDIDGETKNAAGTRHTGNNYEERGRTFMALRGQITRATADGKRQVIAPLGDYKDMMQLIKNQDWNSVHIIARGNTMIHMLNGQVMSILIDDDEKNRTMDGQLGVQVHVGGPMKVEYKNIRLKKL